MTVKHLKSGVTVKTPGRKAGAKKPEPTKNRTTPAQRKPIVNPPRAPAISGAGIVVAFGPLQPGDDADLPPNETMTDWVALPLTPQSLQIQSQGQWNDGVFPLNGWEHSTYGGGELDNISFSGRLEPPAFYVSANNVSRLSAVDSGRWLNSGGGVGRQVVLPNENLDPLQVVRDGDGVLHVVNSGQIGGPVDPGAELDLERKYWSSIQGAQPPTLPGGTDVIMDDGAIAPPGFVWHEPHDLALMLQAVCKGGEVVRLIIGDNWGYNEMISIRSFTWRVEDSDPDVINFDLSARQHRANPMPTGASSAKHTTSTPKAKTYVTKDGDTLHHISAQMWGTVKYAYRIVQDNPKTLAGLWVNTDGRAVGGTYFPAKESAGPPFVPHRPGGHKVGTIRRWPGVGFGPDTYLRKNIRLSFVAPKPAKPKTKAKGKK